MPARSNPLVPAQALEEPEINSPHFHLTVLDTEDDDGNAEVDLLVSTPSSPDIRAHASLGLLYGLALMTLDQDGTIERRMNQLLEAGPVSEVDAVNNINLLLLKEANDHRI